MVTTEYIRTFSTVRGMRDGERWIIPGYGLLGVIAIAALYFAAGGPGNGEAAFAAMVAMP